MGMCSGCNEIFEFSELKDGLCQNCIKNGVLPKVQDKKKSSNPYAGLGIALVVVGLAWGSWAFTMDTTVTSEAQTISEGQYSVDIPSVTVNNLGLMNEQRNHLMGAGVSTIIGVLMLLLGGGRRED